MPHPHPPTHALSLKHNKQYQPTKTNQHQQVGTDTFTFTEFSQLSGLVPLVGINSGRCFAGNTALLACCDVIIACENSTIAMGGPAMIEGGGLGGCGCGCGCGCMHVASAARAS